MGQSAIIFNSRKPWNTTVGPPKALLIFRSELQILFLDSVGSSISFPNWPLSQKRSPAQKRTAHFRASSSPKTIRFALSPLSFLSCLRGKRAPPYPSNLSLLFSSSSLLPWFHTRLPQLSSLSESFAPPFHGILPSLLLHTYRSPLVWKKKSCWSRWPS